MVTPSPTAGLAGSRRDLFVLDALPRPNGQNLITHYTNGTSQQASRLTRNPLVPMTAKSTVQVR
ncbi:MAG TPA: hypothetical protein PLQ00_16125, partial [Thermoguttaceae bacterium]|nr:hypothetical protein [Thermoguttaceae bacterium]